MNIILKGDKVGVTPAVKKCLEKNLRIAFGELSSGLTIKAKLYRQFDSLPGRRFRVKLKMSNDEAGVKTTVHGDYLYLTIYKAVLELEKLTKIVA